MIPDSELKQAYDNFLLPLEQSVKYERQIITGWKELSDALKIYSKKNNTESDRKKFYRIAKKCGFPIHRDGRRIYMFQKDINTINKEYLLSVDRVANYLRIHVKTFYKLLKRYPKMPIDKKRGIAYKPALDLWFASLCIDRLKRGCSIPRFINKNAPVGEGINHVLYAINQMRFSHPKELIKYWLRPEDDILKALQK